MKRAATLLLLILCLTGCRYESDFVCDPRERMLPAKPDPETWAYTKEILKIVNTMGAELEYYHQVWLEHSYAIRDDDGQFYIWLDFSTQSLQDIPGARRLMVKLVTDLLGRLNDSSMLAAAQQGIPFTTDNLYVDIEYTSFYGVYDDPLYVGRSELDHGYMNVFYAHTAFEKEPVYYHKHSEPFETSVEIVAAIEKADEHLRPDYIHQYDRLVSPVDWMSGQPDYVRSRTEDFDIDKFKKKSTLSNYPKRGIESEEQPVVPYDAEGGGKSDKSSWSK